MAGGGGGVGPTEAGFLDIPTYTLSGILLFFLVISLAFERATHWLIQYLKRRKRNGLAQAVSNLVLELTLVGLVSLLLIVLQDPIARICVPYSSSTVQTWSLIGNVNGCDCCLKNTATVGSCVSESRQCGPDFCNCDAKDPSCISPELSLQALLDEWRADPACNAAICSLEYLERASQTPQAATAASVLDYECDGFVKLDPGVCGEGKAQLITVTALHQVHIFIFVVAGTHVVMGIIMILLSSWRLHLWRNACKDEDEHARGVRQLLDSQAPGQVTPRWKRRLSSHALRRHLTGQRRPSRATSLVGPAADSSPANGAAAASQEDVEGGANGAVGGTKPAPSTWPRSGMAAVVAAAVAAAKQAENCVAPGNMAQDGAGHGNGGDAGAAANAAPAPPPGDQQAPSLPPSPLAQAPRPLPPADTAGAELGKSNSRVNILAPVASKQMDGTMLPEVVTAQPQGLPSRQSSGRSASGPNCAFLARSATIKRGDYAGWAKEYAICFLHQFHPIPVSAEELRLMRASFMLTHRVPAGFDFWSYITMSMEDDFSQIVGVSLEMWITLVVFVLISGPLGWVALLFVVLAALVLLVVNIKLLTVIRHVCRGCRVNQLTSNVFWFGRPTLLLHPVKYLLFLCSFMFASVIFFVWSFGAHSCPFNSSFWFAWLPPWWLCLIFSGIMFFDAAMRTLPCYSLAVQMGSDFKHHMLPTNIKHRLLQIAERIKKKHKEQQAAAAALDSSKRSVLGGAHQLLQQFSSALPAKQLP